MNHSVGIVSFGCYVPLMRLQRKAIADAIGWAAPGVKGLAKGQRAVANWDEDAITMAVEAARHCLSGINRDDVSSLTLASTTLPFADRSNSGVAADALNLSENISTEDVSGSRRAASSALIRALNMNAQQSANLLLAADCREAKPGSTQEMSYGHGAAVVLLGTNDPIAVPLASASMHRDLVDQYRSQDIDFDYALEERWVREEGYFKMVPEVVAQALESSQCQASDIDHFVLAGPANVAKALAKKTGLNKATIIDPLHTDIGDCGAAHPLLLLGSALTQAKPDEHILLVGFGQGADAIVFKTTDAIKKSTSVKVFKGALARGKSNDNYMRYLVARQQLKLDYGMRAERDNRTALSTFYRNRDAVTGFIGGRCESCGMLQFPRTAVCVNCGATDTQKPESFAELTGTVKSYTEDWLAYSPCPPLMYGNITFPDGANVMMEFTDFDTGELSVGKEVRMAFRIKDVDDKRHFQRYFWKPSPMGVDNG